MKTANGSPNRAWSGRRRDRLVKEACPGRFERRWGESRVVLPIWQFLVGAVVLAVIAFASFTVATRILWALIYDQETFCEEFARDHPWLDSGEHSIEYICEQEQL